MSKKCGKIQIEIPIIYQKKKKDAGKFKFPECYSEYYHFIYLLCLSFFSIFHFMGVNLDLVP